MAGSHWACFGNHHSHQLFDVPYWSGTFWREVRFQVRWHQFLAKEPKKYVGHTPLAQLAMFFFITLGVSFMLVRIYIAVREDIMSRLSVVSTMISGSRTFKDDRSD